MPLTIAEMVAKGKRRHGPENSPESTPSSRQTQYITQSNVVTYDSKVTISSDGICVKLANPCGNPVVARHTLMSNAQFF